MIRISRSLQTRSLAAVASLVLALGCGDNSATGNDHDGGLPADSAVDNDAYVDNGPLECPEAPEDPELTCVHGRIYDFVTDQPITLPEDGEILGFFINPHDVLELPSPNRGLVARNGRFVTWTNGVTNECLMLEQPIGDVPPTMNCYPTAITRIDELRFYVVHQTDIETWNENYPGEIDLTIDLPLFIGTCFNMDYSVHNVGIKDWHFEYPYGPSDNSYEVYAFENDRLTFKSDPATNYIPESGSELFYVSPDETLESDRDAIINLGCCEGCGVPFPPYKGTVELLLRIGDLRYPIVNLVFFNVWDPQPNM